MWVSLIVYLTVLGRDFILRLQNTSLSSMPMSSSETEPLPRHKTPTTEVKACLENSFEAICRQPHSFQHEKLDDSRSSAEAAAVSDPQARPFLGTLRSLPEAP